MEIPKLNPRAVLASKNKTIPIIVIVVVLGLTSGFWLSRFLPSQPKGSTRGQFSAKPVTLSDQVRKDQLEVGVAYGQIGKTFTDSATGVIKEGSINGVGTHILEREGGPTQTASLTSSAVDLDLFIDRKVEVKGETNSSKKTSWLLDVGTIKILE